MIKWYYKFPIESSYVKTSIPNKTYNSPHFKSKDRENGEKKNSSTSANIENVSEMNKKSIKRKMKSSGTYVRSLW